MGVVSRKGLFCGLVMAAASCSADEAGLGDGYEDTIEVPRRMGEESPALGVAPTGTGTAPSPGTTVPLPPPPSAMTTPPPAMTPPAMTPPPPKSPAAVAGEYLVELRNGKNECDFAGWREGEVTRDVPLKITQKDSAATIEVGGLAGLAVNWLLLGVNTYTGTIDDKEVEGVAYGTKSHMLSGCTHTYVSKAEVEVDGDRITGNVKFERSFPKNPACEKLACKTEQTLHGRRVSPAK